VTWQLNNPLAFWYLYDGERNLTAMIVQLQTSYGERRLWLTRNELPQSSGPGIHSFQGRFNKDLQVSPFTPTSASYVIKSSDPCLAPLRELNIMVTLKQGERAVRRLSTTQMTSEHSLTSSPTPTSLPRPCSPVSLQPLD
jgi:DUF1365 family protein